MNVELSPSFKSANSTSNPPFSKTKSLKSLNQTLKGKILEQKGQIKCLDYDFKWKFEDLTPQRLALISQGKIGRDADIAIASLLQSNKAVNSANIGKRLRDRRALESMHLVLETVWQGYQGALLIYASGGLELILQSLQWNVYGNDPNVLVAGLTTLVPLFRIGGTSSVQYALNFKAGNGGIVSILHRALTFPKKTDMHAAAIDVLTFLLQSPLVEVVSYSVLKSNIGPALTHLLQTSLDEVTVYLTLRACRIIVQHTGSSAALGLAMFERWKGLRIILHHMKNTENYQVQIAASQLANMLWEKNPAVQEKLKAWKVNEQLEFLARYRRSVNGPSRHGSLRSLNISDTPGDNPDEEESPEEIEHLLVASGMQRTAVLFRKYDESIGEPPDRLELLSTRRAIVTTSLSALLNGSGFTFSKKSKLNMYSSVVVYKNNRGTLTAKNMNTSEAWLASTGGAVTTHRRKLFDELDSIYSSAGPSTEAYKYPSSKLMRENLSRAKALPNPNVRVILPNFAMAGGVAYSRRKQMANTNSDLHLRTEKALGVVPNAAGPETWAADSTGSAKRFSVQGLAINNSCFEEVPFLSVPGFPNVYPSEAAVLQVPASRELSAPSARLSSITYDNQDKEYSLNPSRILCQDECLQWHKSDCQIAENDLHTDANNCISVLTGEDSSVCLSVDVDAASSFSQKLGTSKKTNSSISITSADDCQSSHQATQERNGIALHEHSTKSSISWEQEVLFEGAKLKSPSKNKLTSPFNNDTYLNSPAMPSKKEQLEGFEYALALANEAVALVKTLESRLLQKGQDLEEADDLQTPSVQVSLSAQFPREHTPQTNVFLSSREDFERTLKQASPKDDYEEKITIPCETANFSAQGSHIDVQTEICSHCDNAQSSLPGSPLALIQGEIRNSGRRGSIIIGNNSQRCSITKPRFIGSSSNGAFYRLTGRDCSLSSLTLQESSKGLLPEISDCTNNAAQITGTLSGSANSLLEGASLKHPDSDIVGLPRRRDSLPRAIENRCAASRPHLIGQHKGVFYKFTRREDSSQNKPVVKNVAMKETHQSDSQLSDLEADSAFVVQSIVEELMLNMFDLADKKACKQLKNFNTENMLHMQAGPVSLFQTESNQASQYLLAFTDSSINNTPLSDPFAGSIPVPMKTTCAIQAGSGSSTPYTKSCRNSENDSGPNDDIDTSTVVTEPHLSNEVVQNEDDNSYGFKHAADLDDNCLHQVKTQVLADCRYFESNWSKLLDENTGYFYYWNHQSGVSQWEDPFGSC